ncbi:hypothetical protein H6792_00130 [Candidatus Nomurabacteria bacterium]|nr:hypothetical protein [Candidatus Nomurabacteria bacterium]
MNNRLVKILAIAGVSVGLFVIVYITLISDQDDSISSSQQTVSTSIDRSSDETDSGTSTQSESATTDSSSSSSDSSSNTQASNTYQDGTYQSSQTYRVPGGTASLALELTLSQDIVESMDLTYQASDHESSQYLSRFESQISSKVVGKSLDQISLSRVAGASLTTDAFSLALQDIATEAQ